MKYKTPMQEEDFDWIFEESDNEMSEEELKWMELQEFLKNRRK